ncbi:MAG TPA: hypothetical protein VL068_09085 [Microthrixaceae bacterium]|nr:hypothetical protein [Microthrixaceae bacterium]
MCRETTAGREATARHRRVPAAMFAALVLATVVSCGSPESATPNSAATPTSATPTTAPPGTGTPTTAPREPVTHEFVIPAGTAVKLARGEDVGIIPERLKVRLGDKIKVRNDDTQWARLGLFDVAPGETVSMAFNTPGEMEGVIFSDESAGCGAIPSDADTFIVEVQP